MAQDLSQQVAANEPNTPADNKAASTNVFDQNIVGWVKNYLTPYDPLVKALGNVRISAELNMAQNIPVWPKDYVFCSTDSILVLFNLLAERGALGKELYEIAVKMTQSQDGAEEYLTEKLLYIPSLVNTLMPWDKERCVFHVKKQDFDPNLLKAKTSSIAKMPVWAMCFNLCDENIYWNKEKVAGIIFSRYFIALSDDKQAQVPQHTVSIAGEEPSVLNNMISAVVFEDGSFDLGPFIPLSDNLTFEDFLTDLSKGDPNELGNLKLTDEELEKFKSSALDTAERSRVLFSYLIYAIQNADKVKDANGAPSKIPEHPKVTMTKAGPRFFKADALTHLYLD